MPNASLMLYQSSYYTYTLSILTSDSTSCLHKPALGSMHSLVQQHCGNAQCMHLAHAVSKRALAGLHLHLPSTASARCCWDTFMRPRVVSAFLLL